MNATVDNLKSQYNGEFAEMLGGIVHDAPDGIVTINGQQNIIMFNRAAEEMFGYSAEEIIGNPLTILLPETVKEYHGSLVETFGAGAEERRECVEVVGCHKDGRDVPCEVSISKTQYKGSTYFTAIVRDITDRVERENRVKEQEDEKIKYRLRKKAELLMEVHKVKSTTTGR